MKKFLATLLAAILTLSCACAFAAEGQLVMCTNAEFIPFELTDDNGNVIGFDADLSAEIAKDMGLELVIENMDFDALIAAVATGKADIAAAGLTINDERLATVDFSDTYYTAKQVVIVPKGSDIVSQETLVNKKIGVQSGTTGHWTAEEFTAPENIEAYKKVLDAVMTLQGGKLDCVIIDSHTAMALLASIGDENLEIIDVNFPLEYYAIAVAKNSPELLAAINATIARIKEDGTYDAMVEKWLGASNE